MSPNIESNYSSQHRGPSVVYRSGLVPKHASLWKDRSAKFLSEAVITLTQTEVTGPIQFRVQEGRFPRFCVDYWKLNAIMKREACPKPSMYECIESLSEAVDFSTLDENSGYWKIGMKIEDGIRTAFTSHSGLCRWMKTHFGLRNTPSTIQRPIDVALSAAKWQLFFVLLGNITVFSRVTAELIERITIVLSLSRNAVVILKQKICNFLSKSVSYLSLAFWGRCLDIELPKTDVVKELKNDEMFPIWDSFSGFVTLPVDGYETLQKQRRLLTINYNTSSC